MKNEDPIMSSTVAGLIKNLQTLDPEIQIELREDYLDEDSTTYVLFINKPVNLIS